jgi:transcriptional regulator with XRE-family HTH domain
MTRIVTMLRAYVAQRGLYARVAKRLGTDPSYVSRVANGKRHSKKISLAIEAELNRMHSSRIKFAQPAGQR